MKKSMNIHRRYVPDWGPWEIARELISNSIDACGDDYTLESSNGNNLKLITPTHPTMSQMLHVGSGCKTQDSDEIGIFGEGFKLAVLVATRMGTITCTGKEGTMTFSFEQEFDEDVLHVDVNTRKKTKQFVIDVQVPGVGADIHSKILKNRKHVCLPKNNPGTLRVYHKGIWVADLDGADSLWDWNLPKLNINRDRNLVGVNQITPHIREYMHTQGSQEQWEAIFASHKSAGMMELSGMPGAQKQGRFDITPTARVYALESDAVFGESSAFGPQTPIEAYDAFFAVYDKKSVVCDKYSLDAAQAVVEEGYTPVFGPAQFEFCCRRLGLPMATDVLKNQNEYTPAELDYDHQATLKKMQKFLKKFEIRHKIVPCVLTRFGKELDYIDAEDAGLEVDRVLFEGGKKILVPYFDSRSTADLFALVFRAHECQRSMLSKSSTCSEIAGQLAAEAMEGEYDRGF